MSSCTSVKGFIEYEVMTTPSTSIRNVSTRIYVVRVISRPAIDNKAQHPLHPLGDPASEKEVIPDGML